MQFVWRGVDFITSVDGLNAMFPFLTGSMVLSIGMDILFVVLDVPRVHIMPISLKLSAIVFGSFLCRAGLELVLGRSLGIKVRTEQYVANALSRQDVVRAAILYHYPVPAKIRADHEPTPAQRQLAARLALEPQDFTYHVVQEHRDDTEDVVMFTVGAGKRRAAVVWTEALAGALGEDDSCKNK